MKTVCKKLFSLLLVAVLLISAVPFQASATLVTHNIYFYDFNDNIITIPNVTNIAYHGLNAVPVYPAKPAPTNPAYRFSGVWQDVATGRQFTHGAMITTVVQDMHLKPLYESNDYTCTFIATPPAGYVGTPITAPAAIKVRNGSTFSALLTADQAAALILPDTEHYYFDGWYLSGTNTKLFSATKNEVLNISGNITVQAKWQAKNTNVTFYFTNSSGQVEGYGSVKVPYGGRLTKDQIPALTSFSDYNLGAPAGWKLSNDSNAAFVDPTTITITANTNFYLGYRGKDYQITLDPNLPGTTTRKHWVRANERIDGPSIYVAADPTWVDTALWVPQVSGKAFLGWVAGDTTLVNGNTVVTNPMLSNFTWYGRWTDAAVVQLKIYKDGVTTQPYAEVPIYNVPYGQAVEISKYIKQTDIASKVSNCTWDGKYYLQADWSNYCVNGSAQGSIFMTAYGDAQTPFEVKVMVRGGAATGTGSGSNSTGNGYLSTRPADPTNPATGDNSMIEFAVGTMALAAAALVVMMQLRKRKMI